MIKLVLSISNGAKDVRNRFGMKPMDMIKDRNLKKEIRNIAFGGYHHLKARIEGRHQEWPQNPKTPQLIINSINLNHAHQI